MALLLAACDRKETAPASPAQPVVSAQPAMPPSSQPQGATTVQQWVGKWAGPEATYLEIIQEAGSYTVNIRNLDGVRTFPAEILEDGLRFQRDGVPEFIRATDGKGTGMKWLADKSNCLGIRPGEGYCRG
jgi:hypothetical protein